MLLSGILVTVFCVWMINVEKHVDGKVKDGWNFIALRLCSRLDKAPARLIDRDCSRGERFASPTFKDKTKKIVCWLARDSLLSLPISSHLKTIEPKPETKKEAKPLS